jgi:hypothetical protein
LSLESLRRLGLGFQTRFFRAFALDALELGQECGRVVVCESRAR